MLLPLLGFLFFETCLTLVIYWAKSAPVREVDFRIFSLQKKAVCQRIKKR